MSTLSSTRFAALPLAERIRNSDAASSPAVEVRDEVLFCRLQEGQQEALGHLFDRYASLIRSIAGRILRNASEAEDFVQDLFLFIQRKCGIFDSSKSTARSWIIQMAYHRAIERRRHLTSQQFYSQEEIGGDANQVVGIPTGEGDYSVEAVFGRNGLEQVLKALSEDQRETLRLHFFEGYTLSEISEKLGQPLGSARHHYYRGLDKLRKRMFGNTVPVEKHHET